MLTSPRELDQALRENAELLAKINGDLDRMPSFKRGTKWHLDRAAEKQRLLGRRDMLRGQLRQLAECN